MKFVETKPITSNPPISMIDWPVITSYKCLPQVALGFLVRAARVRLRGPIGRFGQLAILRASRADNTAPSASAMAMPGHSRIVTSVGR